MNALTKQLSNYANYHRDPRNIATHIFGVPMIVLAVTAFLSRPAFDLGGFTFSPAWVAVALSTIFYLRLDLRFGLTMGALLSGSALLAARLAALPTASWLIASVALFGIGWVIQFVGHYYEGRKPAFVDDLVGLLVGPLFITAEAAFALGLRKELKAAIEEVSGPVRQRQAAAAS
ncbi:MAG: DUF962 domain-containing protein [Myxococcaceae bacterium]